MAYAGTLGRRRRKRGAGLLARITVTVLGMAAVGLAAAPVAYMLWPAAQSISPDAPSIPVTVGNVAFNVPPAAIRFRVQRKPGAQPRIDVDPRKVKPTRIAMEEIRQNKIKFELTGDK